MITQTKKFYYVESKEDHIILALTDLRAGPLPLVFNHKGAYRVFRVERIDDLIDALTDYDNLPKLEHNVKMGLLYWDDAWNNTKNCSLDYVFKLLSGAV